MSFTKQIHRNTVKLGYSDHPLGQDKLAVVERWPDYTVRFRLVTPGAQLLCCFTEVDLIIQVCDTVGLDRLHCIEHQLIISCIHT